MNIFILDRDPKTCASYYVDRHIVKIPLEINQMLCTNYLFLLGYTKSSQITDEIYEKLGNSHFKTFPKTVKRLSNGTVKTYHFYKPVHFNHPCTKWLRESKENIEWVFKLNDELLKEHQRRYDPKSNKNKKVFEWLKNNYPLNDFPNIGMTDFALAVKHFPKYEDPVYTYREYYIKDKQDIAFWKNSKIPDWWRKE